MSKELSDQIRKQVMLFKDYLVENYGIIIIENKEINWGIKYSIKLKDENEKGVVVIYCNKKGKCSYSFEKKISDENQRIFADVFINRNNLNNKGKEDDDKDGNEQILKLKDYYEALIPYKDEEFDFITFARELSGDRSEEELNDIRYNFAVLEKIYYANIGGEE